MSLKRSTSNPLKRYINDTDISNHISSHIDYYPNINHHLSINSLTPNKVSSLNQINQNKNQFNIKKISAKVQRKNKKSILKDTQQRIFSEVLQLLDQIDNLKIKIALSHRQVKQLAISHPQIQQKVAFYGYDSKLTKQQVLRVEQQSNKIERMIQQIQNNKINKIQDVLAIQRQRYEQLKRQLSTPKLNDSRSLQQRIKSLRTTVSELQLQRSKKLKDSYPQINNIKQQNELLRQKTLKYLIQTRQILSEQENIEYQLNYDQQNRQKIMNELTMWKKEYNKIKIQNQSLKLKLIRKQTNDSKENYSQNIYLSKAQSNKLLEVQSQIKKGRDRFSQYSSIIKRMQSVNK